jgi:hypothetical protein
MDDEMIETNYVGEAHHASEEPVYDDPRSEYDEQEQPHQSDSPPPESEYRTEPQFSLDADTLPEQNSFETVSETGWTQLDEQPDDQPMSSGAFDSLAEDRRDQQPDERPVAEFDEFSRTEQIPASITASSFDLDDLEILDLPPLENANTQEFAANERPEDQGGGKEIVSLSPELMEQLVQRVVEKLSKDK